MTRHFTCLSIAGLLAVGTLITGTFAASSAEARLSRQSHQQSLF